MGVLHNTLDLRQVPISEAGRTDSKNDAFGRLRISEPVGLFNSQAEYDKLPLIFDEFFSGAGSTTHLPNESTVRMDVTTASGDAATRRSYAYIRYQPGKSQQLFGTFVFDVAKTNLTQRMGLFDDSNGIFLALEDSTLNFVVRSSTSGSPVETKIPQASWNRNPLPDLDISKAQIFWADLEWLGVGQVRFGFVIDGKVIVCHEQGHANVVDKVYMTTANLPICYEIENTGVVASASSLKAICSSVTSEGGFETDRAYQFSYPSVAVTAGVGPTGIVALRQANTYNGLTSRGQVIMDHLEILTTSTGSGVWGLYYIPHVGGSIVGGAWAAPDAASICEVNDTFTSFAGGILIDSGFYVGTVQAKGGIQKELNIRAPIIYNTAGTAYSAWLLASYAFSGTLVTYGSLTWKEIR